VTIDGSIPEWLHDAVALHAAATNSPQAASLLENWRETRDRFRRIVPGSSVRAHHAAPAGSDRGRRALRHRPVAVRLQRRNLLLFRPAAGRDYQVQRTGERSFRVTGAGIERLLARYDLDNEEELAALYRTFDVLLRVRSVPELLNAMGLAEMYGISKTMAKAVFESAGFITAGFSHVNYQVDPVNSRSIDARIDAADQWWETARVYDGLIKPTRKRSVKVTLYKPSVASIALVTLKHQPVKAAEFWGGLAEDNRLAIGDPRKALLDAFDNQNRTRGSIYVAAGVPTAAWNAWFRGKSIKTPRYYEGSRLQIAGTPYFVGKPDDGK